MRISVKCAPYAVCQVNIMSFSVSTYALQLDDDILCLAQKDEMGRVLQDLSLKNRMRASKKG